MNQNNLHLSDDLKPQHKRMLKTLNTLIHHALVTDDEGEYFDTSAEIIRLAASIIKQSNFVEMNAQSDIPYTEQVLEYTLDLLQENIENSKVITYDN